MNAYCSRQNLDQGQMVFLYDGERISPENTPEQLGMEDNDEIDAMIESAKIEIGEMPESGTWMGVSTEGGESQGQDQGVSEVPPKRRR